MASGWFASLGWWEQKKAYEAFNLYRLEPTPEHYDDAVNKALPIIRVVYSTQKFKVTYGGDEDDLIAHAALTITKALPKMIKKPTHKLDDDKKYMRYLFTCVINAFYREYDILHGKHNKLQRKLTEHSERATANTTSRNFKQVEAEMTLKHLPQQLYALAEDMIRFTGQDRQICVYIINQLIEGREVAKSVLQLTGCRDRNFFISYCEGLLLQAFIQLRRRKVLAEVPDTVDGYDDLEVPDFSDDWAFWEADDDSAAFNFSD
jgi:hypothetical protein